MAAPGLSSLIIIGLDVLATSISTKTRALVAQLGDVVGESVDADEVEWWQQPGLISRPSRAEKGKAACQTVSVRRGGVQAIIAARDLRGLELAGEIDDGEFCLFAGGADGKGQARVIGKKDGSVHIYTRKGNAPDGSGMTIQIDAQANAIRLLNAAGNGIVIGEDGVEITAGGAALTLGTNGAISLVGTGQTVVDGASVVLGARAVPGVDNVLTGPGGPAAKPSPKVFAQGT